MAKINKAIIMVAGWGTRMLPITKSIEKCMLPIGKRPVIDYIVQDLVLAGIRDIYFVVGEQSAQLQSYYRTNIPLSDYLKRNGKADYLPLVEAIKGVNTHFIVQPSVGKYGTSVPASLVNEFIDTDELALYMNGDNFFYRTDGGSCAADLMELVSSSGLNAGLLCNELPHEEISKFGVVEKDENNRFVRVIEKPASGETTSNLNNSGFYLFPKRVFELATSLPANPKRGEYEITDAINAYVQEGNDLIVGVADGDYLECGSVEGWLRANNRVVAGA